MAPKKRKQSDITVNDIGTSTSSFGKKAEHYLNIHIDETDLFDVIINDGVTDKITYEHEDINSELKDLFLHDLNRDAIRAYKPEDNKQLPEHVQTFIYKLSLVVNNNYVEVEPPHVEKYIHDLMNNILRKAKFEEGTELILMPCLLRLAIGEESFAAYADTEGRRGTRVIWVIDEDKHKFDKRWKQGDVQLIANMIAAAQHNRVFSRKNSKERFKIIGIKFNADNLYFYSACIGTEYLDELSGLSPDESCNVRLVVKKFPKSKDLSLSIYEDRKEIFMYLSALRKYALRIKPIYT